MEHLLRDVKDTTISTLATEVLLLSLPYEVLLMVLHLIGLYFVALISLLNQVTSKLAALKGLDARLREIRGYLDLVVDGKLPLNHEILYHLQVLHSL